MKNALTIIVYLALGALIPMGFYAVLSAGLNNAERAECLGWQKEAVEYPLWYSTAWQRAQCEAHNLPLPK